MASARYVRVVVRASKVGDLATFLGNRVLDLGGRPHRAGDVWQAEFYVPEADARGLAAEGCTFHVDETFFDRLQQARRDEQARSLTRAQLEEIVKSGRFPSADRDDPGRNGKP
jgi:hypothetical protein